jgi:tetratricopeptide (TPR) repeat protein
MNYQLGSLPQSATDLKRALTAMGYSLTPHTAPTTTVEKFKEEILACLMRFAMCYQSVGNYRQSIAILDQLLKIDADSNVWFQRELVLFHWGHLDTELESYCIDDKVWLTDFD